MKALATFAKWLGIFLVAIILYVWDPVQTPKAALGVSLLLIWGASIAHEREHDKERAEREAQIAYLHERIDKTAAMLAGRIRDLE